MVPSCIAATALVFALATPAVHVAPDLHFERIGSEGGPPPAVITALHQDKAGFLWVGSRNGLLRFDGYGWESFQHDPSDPGSIADNTVRTIYEEPDGTLWFGTNAGGLDRFDPATRSFVHHRHDGADPRSLSHPSVYTILRDRNGTLWVGTQKGLNRQDAGTQGWTRVFASGPEGLTSDYILTVYEDRAGRLWVGTLDGGLCLWDPKAERFTAFRHDPTDPTSIVGDRVFALLEDDAGHLWVGTLQGLTRMNPELGSFQTVSDSTAIPGRREPALVTAIVAGPPGRLWVGTHGRGLGLVDTANLEMRFWRQDPARRDSLTEDKILALLPDRAGALWIGTWGGGLNRLSPVSQRFDGPGGGGFPPSDVRDRDVTALLDDGRGGAWVGTRTGFALRLDPATGKRTILYRGGAEGISRIIIDLELDRRGGLWIASSGSLERVDPASGEARIWEHDPADPTSLGPGYVTAVFEDRAGQIWVGTGEGGLQRLDAGGRVVQRIRSDSADPGSLSDDYVTTILEDRRGKLWVGTRSGGLNEVDPRTGRARRFLPVAEDPSSLGHRYVTSLLEDARGDLWVGTGGGGLNRLVRAEDGGIRFERVTERDGLIDDDVTALLEDDDGTLWVSTRRGLSRLHIERKAFTNLFVSDGLPSAEFESGSGARSGSRLYLGTVRGLVELAAGTPFVESPASPVVVRSVRNGEGEIRFAGGVEIPYGEWLSVEFVVLDFNPERDHAYAYRLADDWIDLGARREITFTSLQPGTHELRVRGRNSQGVWGEASGPLRITVVPPFWMTLPFRVLVAMLVLAAAFGVHWRRTSVLERRNRELMELHRQREKARQELDDAYQRLRRLTRRLEAAKEDERQRIARELHDEMGPSLTAVIINLQLLSTQRGTESFARRIEDSVDLVDRMIQRIRDISLDLRPPLIDELGLAAALSGYLESVSERTGMRIDLQGDKDLGPLPAHVPMTAFRVVQESVTNVLRHAGAARIEVTVRRDGARLDLRVEDDGRGFDVEETMQRAATGRALGLLGMQERVGMLHGDIRIDSSPGGGTRVHVRLPLAEAA
ncbi:MAG TPA: two-component regulator propeller domain-containing protein [Candidatus Polarisedimenticolaceae bacterium]